MNFKKPSAASEKHKSTVDATFIARRLLDIAEQGKEDIALVFLDWEEAIDKMYRDTLIEALVEIGIRDKIIHTIQAIYRRLVFQTKVKGRESTYTVQGTGIKQGKYCTQTRSS